MRLVLTTLALFGMLSAGAIQARTQIEISVANQYSYRGLRQTESGTAVSGSVDYASDSGWYLGFWSGRVDYARVNDERFAEIDYYLGYQQQVSANLALDLGVTRYTYHGDSFVDYDWTDYHLTAQIRDRWRLSLSVGENWLGRRKTSMDTAVSYHHPISEIVTLDVGAGHHDVDRLLGFAYQYGNIGLGVRQQAWQLRAGYTATRGAERFGALAASRWLLTMNWTLYDR